MRRAMFGEKAPSLARRGPFLKGNPMRQTRKQRAASLRNLKKARSKLRKRGRKGRKKSRRKKSRKKGTRRESSAKIRRIKALVRSL
jgi:hypothetical protein